MTNATSPAQPKHRLALFALAIGSFGLGTSEFSSMGLLQLFATDLAVEIPRATNAITAYALGVVVGAPLVTLAAAKLNRRTLLLLLMGLFVIGNLLSGLAHSLGLLMLGRFISGMPQGAYFGAGAVIAMHIVGPAKGGKAFALIASGLTVATIVGAPIGTSIGQTFGWRVSYLLYAGYGTLAVAAMALWLPRTSALDGSSVRQELSALRRWKIWAMMVVAALGVASVFAVYTFVGPLITDVAGMSAARIPVAQTLFGIGLALGTIVGGRLADRFAFRGMVIGFGATLAVLCIMALFGTYPAILLPTLFGIGFCIQMAIPTIPVRMIQMAPEAPTLMGAMNMAAFNAANAIGAVAGGLTIAAGYGILSAIWAGFVLTALGLAVFALLYRPLRANEA